MVETGTPKFAIATNTSYPLWYRGDLKDISDTDKVRGDLALEFFGECQERKIPVVAVDSQSVGTFLEAVSNFKNVKLFVRLNYKRSPSRRLAISQASKIPGVEYLILTEPEKVSLITDCLELIKHNLLENNCDLLIPSRQNDLFGQTYPSFQYESESAINRELNRLLAEHGFKMKDGEIDFTFGPRILLNKPNVIQLFLGRPDLKMTASDMPVTPFGPEEYSNTSTFPIILALKKGFKVQTLEMPFRYPSLQKQNENTGERKLFVEKRQAQHKTILLELTAFLAYLEKTPGSI